MMAHHCHATGCKTAVPPEMFMCKKHWFSLPKTMRDAIWQTYRPGQCDDWNITTSYADAARAAVRFIAEKENRKPDTAVYDMLDPKRTTTIKEFQRKQATPKILALDTETTGIDFHHGAKPYFVTTCDQDDNQLFWEWDVDPLTREPIVPKTDVDEIVALIESADELVLHNTTFDFHALQTILPQRRFPFPWGKVQDTLMAGHILGTTHPHDLTSMGMMYLGYNAEQFELLLEVACKKARQMARTRFPEWHLAGQGKPDMPSCKGTGKSDGNTKDSNWKADMWLLRVLARELGYGEPSLDCDHQWGEAHDSRCGNCGGHRWYVLCQDYANMDTALTIRLWGVVKQQMLDRDIYSIYQERMKLLPVKYRIKARSQGVTISAVRTREQREKFTAGVDAAREACEKIAKRMRFDLTMPKSGNSQALTKFAFDILKLPVLNTTDSGNPSLAAEQIAQYLGTRDAEGNPNYDGEAKQGAQYEFVKNLSAMRHQTMAVQAINGYEAFWLPPEEDMRALTCKCGKFRPIGFCGDCRWWFDTKGWYALHPDLNPTGTGTLRWSSRNPNLQNISKKKEFNLRYVFGPAPGREHWSLDFKNIELRVPAYESGEQDLIALFEEPDAPPFYGSEHLLNFSVVYPALWKVNLAAQMKNPDHIKTMFKDDYYQWCKNGDFALQYNCGRAKADETFRVEGAYDLLKSRFAKKTALNNKQVQFANRHGYVETIPDKTVNPRHGYPIMCTRTESGRVLNTVPLAHHVAGTAMWLTATAMPRCQDVLEEWNRKCGVYDHYRMILQVHDELFFDFPKAADPIKNPKGSNLWRVREIAKRMAIGGDNLVCRIPSPVSVEYHPCTWNVGVAIA